LYADYIQCVDYCYDIGLRFSCYFGARRGGTAFLKALSDSPIFSVKHFVSTLLFERPIIMGCQSSKDNAPPSPVNITGGYDYRIQFLLLGPEAVGKTAIITQFVENKFSSESGAGKYVKCPDNEAFVETPPIGRTMANLSQGKKKVTVHIELQALRYLKSKWYKHDFEPPFQSPFRRSSWQKGIIFVYDITRLNTYRQIQECYSFINNENVGMIDGKGLLLGNKMDEVPSEDDQRDSYLHVLKKDAAAWARSKSLPFAEVSAKTGQGIDEAILRLAESCLFAMSRTT